MENQEEQIENVELNVAQTYVDHFLLEKRRAKLESVRLAKDILTENARTLPVDSRQITGNDVVALAAIFVNYIEN
jgi:hypothetical protein